MHIQKCPVTKTESRTVGPKSRLKKSKLGEQINGSWVEVGFCRRSLSDTVWSLLRDPPVEIRRPFVRPQLQYHLPALCAGRDLKQPFVSHRSLLSGGDKQKIQGVNKIEI